MLLIFDISHNNISDDGAVAIGEALRSHYKDNSMVTTNEGVTKCTLQKLDMSYNNISSEGIVALSDCLKCNNTLQHLTISWNDYENFCENELVLNAIDQFCDMSYNFFGDIGTILISACMFQNDRIQKLDISFNDISDDGAAAISEYLKANRALQELYVSNNDITNHGILNITESIQMNTTLRLLDISENYLLKSREIVIALNGHFKHNNSLQVLGISWNDSDIIYVYTVGINNECYVGNTWPRSVWTNNTVHYIREYNHEKLDRWPQFDQCLNDTVHKINKLQFDDTEAILLTTLVQHSFDVRKHT